MAILGVWEERAHVGMRRDNACDVFSFFCEAGGEATGKTEGHRQRGKIEHGW